jgi:hypothetical protein
VRSHESGGKCLREATSVREREETSEGVRGHESGGRLESERAD